MSQLGEFSYGSGLIPPRARGYVGKPGGGGGHGTAFDQLKAIQNTDPENPTASHDRLLDADAQSSHWESDGINYTYSDLRPGRTSLVTEKGQAPAIGQHKIIDPLKPSGGIPRKEDGTPGHYADGLQDGAGQAWRDSVPPNPHY